MKIFDITIFNKKWSDLRKIKTKSLHIKKNEKNSVMSNNDSIILLKAKNLENEKSSINYWSHCNIFRFYIVKYIS